MEQDHIENSTELLQELLSNPSSPSEAAVSYLEQLLKREPQSGLLQAIYACSGNREKLRSAALYFNSVALYKMANAPDTLAVPQESQFVNYTFPEETISEPAETEEGATALTVEPGEVDEEGNEPQPVTDLSEEDIAIDEADIEAVEETQTGITYNEALGDTAELQTEAAAPVEETVAASEPAETTPAESPVQDVETIQQQEADVKTSHPIATPSVTAASDNIAAAAPEGGNDDEIYEEIIGIEDINFDPVNKPFTADELAAIAAQSAAETTSEAEKPAEPVADEKPAPVTKPIEIEYPEDEFGIENVGEETEIYIAPDEDIFIPVEPGTMSEIFYGPEDPASEGFEFEEEQATEKSQIPPIPIAAMSSERVELFARPAAEDRPPVGEEGKHEEPAEALEEETEQSITEDIPATEEPVAPENEATAEVTDESESEVATTEESVTAAAAAEEEPQQTEETDIPPDVTDAPATHETEEDKTPEAEESTEEVSQPEPHTVAEPLAELTPEEKLAAEAYDVATLVEDEIGFIAEQEPEEAEPVATAEPESKEEDTNEASELTEQQPVEEAIASTEETAPIEEQDEIIQDNAPEQEPVAVEEPYVAATEEEQPAATEQEPVTAEEEPTENPEEIDHTEEPETVGENAADENEPVVAEEEPTETPDEAATTQVEAEDEPAEEEESSDTPVEEPVEQESEPADEPVVAEVETPVAEQEPAVAATAEPESTPAPATKPEPIEDETEKLIIESIASADYFVFDQTFGEITWADKAEDQVPDYNNEVPTNDEPIEQQELGTEANSIVVRYNDDKMPYSFMWWLDKTRREHSTINQPYAPKQVVTPNPAEVKLQPAAEEKPVPPPIEFPQPYELEAGPEQEYDIRKKEDKIIERFIQEEPHIKPPSSDKLNAENKARKSAEDHNEMITETLARIYTDQRLWDKAIITYEKLMLKYPQKSSYFASLIEELKKEIS